MRAVINDSADIFTLINTFTVVPQKQGDVVKSLSDFTEQHARSLDRVHWCFSSCKPGWVVALSITCSGIAKPISMP